MATIPLPRLSSHFDLQDPRFSSLVYQTRIKTPITPTTGVTYTAAQIQSGFILRSGPTGAVTDTLPSAAAICAAIQGPFVNLSFEFRVRNISTGSLNFAVGAGGTPPVQGTFSCATVSDKMLLIILTNVTIGQETYQVESWGGGTY
jgi:hypothetical protein